MRYIITTFGDGMRYYKVFVTLTFVLLMIMTRVTAHNLCRNVNKSVAANGICAESPMEGRSLGRERRQVAEGLIETNENSNDNNSHSEKAAIVRQDITWKEYPYVFVVMRTFAF